ncbi:hypothetical protein DC522_29860 [Microvirga sp. KLBC 81]|uniref:hypothetical protein n=1 Tax=Microvirga sp. KLBC 81 TaxID=1862707 RepID=UPI000D520077|nr:hypothetical protein [Microvirga sp. KLBC 81]PVE20854.1 hypothetical protein DC522_29860 [Microvirga sp. KLBC 81]
MKPIDSRARRAETTGDMTLSPEPLTDWVDARESREMQPISYARHQFLPEIIRHAVWLYLHFTLS